MQIKQEHEKLTLYECLMLDKSNLWARLKRDASQSAEDWLLFMPKGGPKGRVLIVAHMDTFHDADFVSPWSTWSEPYHCIQTAPKEKKRIFFDGHSKVYWSPQGLGADDRAGVYAAMHLFYTLTGKDQPIVLLTDGEESGGIGATSAAWELKDVCSPANFIVELDRRGEKDCVFYNDDPAHFIAHIESFGFRKTWGSFSDISILAPKFQLASVNVSIGFYHEHEKREYLAVRHMEQTIDAVKKMLQVNSEVNQKYTHIPKPKTLNATVTTIAGYKGMTRKERKRLRKKNRGVTVRNWRDDDKPERIIITGGNDRDGYEVSPPSPEELTHVRCKQCDFWVDLRVYWDAECPGCGTPLTL